MGSNAIFSVLSLLVIFAIVDVSINKSNLHSYENTYGYSKYTTARDIARNSIQVAIRKIDTAKTITAMSVSGNLGGGTFIVHETPVDDTTFNLAASATFYDTTYRIKTKMERHPVKLPPGMFGGAFGVSSDSVQAPSQASKDTVDGRNHDVFGNLIPGSPDSVPAVQARTVTDSANIVNGFNKDLSRLIGTPKIEVDPTMADPNAFGDQFKFVADTVYANSNGGGTVRQVGNGSTSMGDSAHPMIVFCDGTNKTTGKTDGKFQLKSKDGWGILVVKGFLDINGGATWHGPIIVFGNIPLTLSSSGGNSQIFGAILFGGAAGGTYGFSGNAKVLYSKAAIQLALDRQTLETYSIVDWYEGY